MSYFDVIIIGAGGAGLMCASHAGQMGKKVCLIDHNYKVGRKILISGGGRCNFTNVNTGPANYQSLNPHFCKSALSRYSPQDFIKLVERHRIPFHEKKLGQLFCDHSAQQIVDMLLTECQYGSVNFKLATRIASVKRQEGGFEVVTNHERYSCNSLVVATGGLSIPHIGATSFGYDIARQFGLRIVDPLPALVGFNFSKKDHQRYDGLAGVSLDSITSCNKMSFRENILFTHTGLSGPAILQASLYWNQNDALNIDLVPDIDLFGLLKSRKIAGNRAELKNVLGDVLPKRLAERLTELYFPSRPLNELADSTLSDIAKTLGSWRVVPGASVGFSKAEVTKGGVDTDDLSSKTMEAKRVPGLYFIGEVVDVTGQLGGYNFQWAWASAVACAESL